MGGQRGNFAVFASGNLCLSYTSLRVCLHCKLRCYCSVGGHTHPASTGNNNSEDVVAQASNQTTFPGSLMSLLFCAEACATMSILLLLPMLDGLRLRLHLELRV